MPEENKPVILEDASRQQDLPADYFSSRRCHISDILATKNGADVDCDQ